MMPRGRFALLIGVGRYDAPEIPLALGVDTDLARLWRVCINQLQMRPEDITVLHETRVSAQTLVGGVIANRERWLALAARTQVRVGCSLEQISQALQDYSLAMGERGVGWIHFSGHGGELSEGGELAMLPQDYDSPEPQVLDFQLLSKLLGTELESVGARSTLSVDCCWSGEVAAVAAAVRRVPSPFRVLLGVSPGQSARVLHVEGDYGGAFSWALGLALSRWSRRQCDGTVELQVNHRDLIRRIEQLLQAVGSEQVPCLGGRRDVDDLPLFHPGSGSHHSTAHLPNAYSSLRQLWPGTGDFGVYALRHSLAAPDILGHVSVDSTTAPGVEFWQGNQQLWRFLDAALSPSAVALDFRKVSSAPPMGPGAPHWTLVEHTQPAACQAGDQAAATLLFVHNDSLILGVECQRVGLDILIISLQWWARILKPDDTLNPAPSPVWSRYDQVPSPYPVGDGFFQFPAQSVDQLISKPAI